VAVIPSPFDDVEIPDQPLTDFVLARAEELGDKPALIDGTDGRVITYAELRAAVNGLATGLAERGFKQGDVLAIFLPNCPEYAIAFHAVATLGGVNTTINPVYAGEELSFQLKDAGARFLLTAPALMETVQGVLDETEIDEVFVVGEAEGATSFASLIVAGGEPPAVSIAPDDLVVLPYSSGTTGLPKGVMLTHRNLVANIIQTQVVQQLTEDDVQIAVLPFFHIYGMQVIMNLGLWQGSTLITLPRFDLEKYLSLIQEYRVTRVNVVPPIALALAKHPLVDDFDVSSLNLVFSGAAPLGPELAEACSKRLDCPVNQGYGMTELSPVTHAVPLGVSRPGSIGPPVPSTECRIVDPDTGKDAEPGKPGEIWCRGPQVMAGYLNNAEATASTVDHDGWLHTGDIGYADEESFFFIVDRLKELIKFKGFQVAPAELEAVLVTHTAVADAAVIGVPDEEAGEVPKAFVVLASETTVEDITAHVAGQVASYKQIRHIEIVEEIPKSPSGKILRRLLVQRERERQAAS
jgi:acyl-CoA synthetase (AMP-forming)/AMP-acid ligase II